ncbi:ankyrin repeat domain-containing protein [Candidatus Mesenet endosymbiont of Agriotes lineatus]|uniref:ankyrin repeat domain-containing protein n=1 Tax=Candidatus Mesenet endosymbiont of Agriotes lineatus TaxID=3077948 RepID=UPI0030D48CAD
MIGSNETLATLERKLFEEVRSNNIKGVIEILGLGLDINAQNHLGLTPIFLATLHNNLSMVKKLAKLGADLETKDKLGDTVLSKVLSRQYPRNIQNIPKEKRLPTVKILIELGAKLTTRTCGSLPIHVAIKERLGLNIVAMLLTRDTINEQDIQRRTPLYLAISLGQSNIVKFLLQHEQIDVNINIEKDYEEDTPLMLAAKKQYVEIVILLLLCGAIPSQMFLQLRILGPMQLLIQSIKCILSQSVSSDAHPYCKYLFILYKEYKENQWFRIPFKPIIFINSISKLCSPKPSEEHQRKTLSAITNRSAISRLYRTSFISSPGPKIHEELRRRMLDATTPRSVISEPPRPCSITSVSTSSPGPSTPELLTLNESSVSSFESISSDLSQFSISETSLFTKSYIASTRSSFSDSSSLSASSLTPSGSYAVGTKRKKSDHMFSSQ